MIGIIGGAGPLASALLYQLIVEEYYLRQKQGETRPLPEMLFFNHTFPRGLTLEESDHNKKRLENELEIGIQQLRQAGASTICIACNTLHSFLTSTQEKSLLHLPQAVIASLREKGLRRVGILSTETTRNSTLYRDKKILLEYPSKEDQSILNPILDRILEGVILREDSICLSQMIQKMRETQNIEGIILGCTDLSVLNHRYPLHTKEVLLFDSIKILATNILL